MEKKIALYQRVSTSQNQTTLNQTDRLVKYAKENGYEYDLYDEVESTRKTRPVKQQLLKRLRSGEYESVVVVKLDRWARSSTELILEVKELLDKGIQFISLIDNLDFSTAGGRLQFQILCAFSEFERDLISSRTREGLARVRKEKTLGRPKGSKDKKKRKKSGYILREATKRQLVDQGNGIHKSIEEYIDTKQ